jgi:hypothetical protein
MLAPSSVRGSIIMTAVYRFLATAWRDQDGYSNCRTVLGHLHIIENKKKKKNKNNNNTTFKNSRGKGGNNY